MYARVVTVQIQPGTTDEAVAIFRDSVLPAATWQRGFNSALLLTDQNAGKAISVTFWETESYLFAGESSGYLQEQVAKLESVLACPPAVLPPRTADGITVEGLFWRVNLVFGLFLSPTSTWSQRLLENRVQRPRFPGLGKVVFDAQIPCPSLCIVGVQGGNQYHGNLGGFPFFP